MGRRGPKPRPTALHELTGSWRAGTRQGEPRPNPELPACPEWVSAKARVHWGEIGAMMEGLNVMAIPHTIALALLVDALADWIHYTREAEIDGAAYRHKRAAWEAVMKACREFGMTPSAITGVKTIRGEEKPQGLGAFKLGA